MALFSSRKRHDSSQPAPVGASSPAPEPITAQRVQISPAPLGAGLRLVSVAVPEATATPPAPEALPASEETRADDLRGLPLGTILYRRGLVEQSELEEALASGMESGERLGEVLIRRGLVAEEEIGRCLAAQQGLPFLDGEDLTVDPEVVALLSAADAHELGAIPVSIKDGFLLVVRPEPSPQQRGRLEAVLGREVTEAVVSRAVFASLIERVENGQGEVTAPGAPSAQAPEPGPESDAGWFGAEAAPEQSSPAVAEVAPVEDGFPQSAGVAAEMHEAEPKEEQQMEQSWNAEPAESSVPTASLQSSDDAESGVTDHGGWAEPAQEQSSWNGDHVTAGFADLAPVADDPDAEASTQDWNEPAETDEQGWDDLAGESAEEHPFSSGVSWSDSDHSSAESEFVPAHVVDTNVPDSGRIEELGADYEASVGRIDELLVRIHEGATTFTDLRAQIGDLTDNLRTTEEALADREHRLGALADDHAAAQQRIDELVHELQERDNALSGLGQRLEDLTGRLGSAEERLDEREQRLAELDASLGERVRHVEELSAQVERRDHALSAFEEKLAAIAAQFAAGGA